jgi:hypothetical protein
MQIKLARVLMTAAVLVFGSTVLASAATSATPTATIVAQATPAPKATPTPNPFTYNGYVRAFYFTRTNASIYPKGTGQLNQASFNAAVKLHGEYHFGATPWIVGATYVQANPLGYNAYCDDIGNYGAGGTCQQYPTNNNNFKMSDTTLPGYALSTLGEAYLQYKDKYLNAKVGNQSFTSPWANPSDSRVKQVYFEGVDANYTVAPGWTIGASRMIQWESRVSSDFNKSNLLPGSLNTNGTIKNPTTGFLLGKASYVHGSDFAANINFYNFYDVSSLLWLDGKWYPWAKSPMKFFIAGQFGSANSIGRAIAGTINNQTIGAQIGASAGKNVDLTFGFDTSPWRSMDITAATCAAAQTASGLFMPASGTPTCLKLATGMYRIFYGGIASPYTDSYATDPLYTTSISQGMADRRSAGDSFKLAATYHTTDNKFKAVVSRAWYDYSNSAGSGAKTFETNVDFTYFFNKVGKGAYHGFQIRHRYAERQINNTILFGGLPIFKYNRTQLEYDF